MNKSLFSIFCFLLQTILLPHISFATDDIAAIWRLPPIADLIEQGLRENKNLHSLREQEKSLRHSVSYAASLDDPKIGFGLLNLPADTYSFDQEPMTQKQIFVSQKFPWFGKLSLKEQKALYQTQIQSLILQSKELELAQQISAAYFDLAFIVKSKTVNEKLTSKVEQILRTVEVSYATGRGLQQDVLQAQVELSKLLNNKIDLDQQQATLTYRLTELLDASQTLSLPSFTDFTLPDLHFSSERISKLAREHNLDLQTKKINMAMAEVDTRLAEKTYWPDMDVRLSYGQRDESQTGVDWADFVSATVTVNLPLWKKNRQDKQIAASKNRAEAAAKSFQNLYDTLPTKTGALLAEIKAGQENYNLFTKGLLLQADQAAKSSLAAYEVGKIEFNSMMTSQIRLLQFELQAQKYLFNTYKKWVELARLIGLHPLAANAVENENTN